MFGVFLKRNGFFDEFPVKKFDTKDEAKTEAKTRRKSLTSGERGYYKLSYGFKKV